MTIAAGTLEYTCGNQPSIGNGYSYTQTELDQAIQNEVSDIAHDTQSQNDFEAFLNSLPSAQFDMSRIKQALIPNIKLTDWYVGEAIADAYLSKHRNCHFPFPLVRDVRNPSSNMTGTDHVGFYSNGNGYVFAFAEVKTSQDLDSPPSVMQSLKDQIKSKTVDEPIVNQLIKYMRHKCTTPLLMAKFQSATIEYFNQATDYRVFGFLVRDVKPNENDIYNCVNNLNSACRGNLKIEIIALYLPAGSIPLLAESIN